MATQYFANFFVREARKSRHVFGSEKEEAAKLIDNYHPIFLGYPFMHSAYYFNNTSHQHQRQLALHRLYKTPDSTRHQTLQDIRLYMTSDSTSSSLFNSNVSWGCLSPSDVPHTHLTILISTLSILVSDLMAHDRNLLEKHVAVQHRDSDMIADFLKSHPGSSVVHW
ncbi:hypothetical protein NP493_738g01010 [Ridgeia piscesae]|uniref:Uncharacterized protein n=1 Tax=Ridgeia piscesae TaxID=27915 RepID=A0AAD9KQ76_RIDPI|nr:hypothetical protein NP493_738g01010 [Ridgeia piscesae]